MLSTSDTHTEEDDLSGQVAKQLIQAAGHTIVRYELVANSVADVRDRLEPYLADRSVDVVVTLGGTGVSSRDLTVTAIEAMGGRPLEGFGQLYRQLSYAEVGALAMMSRSGLYLLQRKPVFALPGSDRAVRTALATLILPGVQHLVGELER